MWTQGHPVPGSLRKGVICGRERLLNVALGHCAAQEHVVPRMKVDAALDHGPTKRHPETQVRVALKEDHRHLYRTRLAQLQSVGFRSLLEALSQRFAQSDRVFEILRVGNELQ